VSEKGGNNLTGGTVYPDGMIFIVLAIIIGWKIIKRTRYLHGTEVDLVSDLRELDEYTADVSIFSRTHLSAADASCSCVKIVRSP
jgi:hypothetical protein